MEKNHLNMQTKDSTSDYVNAIIDLFPECGTEKGNKRVIDFDKLRSILGDYIVEDIDERYQFTWPDKRKAKNSVNIPTADTLRPCRIESVDFDNTKNLYIEGDNLTVLKLLKINYLNRVKMIYIDPPYNTGNDFIYPDNFNQSATVYKDNSGQYDEEGNQLVPNPESNGRFHTDWLNMIYPRLKIARDLLAPDGVIFISIDDNEVHNLRKVCDEIFGEHNFVAQLIWKSRQNKDNRNITGVSIDHEYIIVYARNASERNFIGAQRNTNGYSNPDNDPLGPWTSANMVGMATESQRPNLHYDLINPKTGINYGRPRMGWRYDKNTMSKLIQDERIIWPETASGRPRKKSYLNELKDDKLPGFSSLVGKDLYTRVGSIEIEQLFGERYFPFPKPSELVSQLLEQVTDKDSIILDFFSGSATTAHAVMQLNAEDNGNRRYVMVQVPEKCDEKSEAYKAGYKNICEIGKERIRRAGKKIKGELEKELSDVRAKLVSFEAEQNVKKQGSLDIAVDETEVDKKRDEFNTKIKDLEDRISKLDIGFRVLKVDTSNMHDVFYSPAEFTESTLYERSFEYKFKQDRTAEDLLFQVMLEHHTLLSDKIECKEVDGKEIFCVDGNKLIACFEAGINEHTITEIAKMQPEYFVLRDDMVEQDNVLDNYSQLFGLYSKDTVIEVL